MGVGMILQWLRPLRLAHGLRPVGRLLLLAGVAINVVAVYERGGGDLEDPQPLTTHGLHRMTRNPMYVGFSAIHIGASLGLSTGWVLATWPTSLALVHQWVLIEEGRLSERLGEEYAT
jgi:protein-S-isoprenylcysteine O-methyltransferase Ste14